MDNEQQSKRTNVKGFPTTSEADIALIMRALECYKTLRTQLGALVDGGLACSTTLSVDS
jgi:hypothetical protein